MSTSCEIAVPTTDGRWAQIYVHFDGYPEWMIPVLDNYTPNKIQLIGCMTFIGADSWEPTDKEVIFVEEPVKNYDHLYVWRDGKWREEQ